MANKGLKQHKVVGVGVRSYWRQDANSHCRWLDINIRTQSPSCSCIGLPKYRAGPKHRAVSKFRSGSRHRVCSRHTRSGGTAVQVGQVKPGDQTELKLWRQSPRDRLGSSSPVDLLHILDGLVIMACCYHTAVLGAPPFTWSRQWDCIICWFSVFF
jgi:hypothetical protein